MKFTKKNIVEREIDGRLYQGFLLEDGTFQRLFELKRNGSWNANRYVLASIINFGDERGDIVVSNDNYGLRRKYPSFRKGCISVGLHPLQIVYSGPILAHILNERYIGFNGKEYYF